MKINNFTKYPLNMDIFEKLVPPHYFGLAPCLPRPPKTFEFGIHGHASNVSQTQLCPPIVWELVQNLGANRPKF